MKIKNMEEREPENFGKVTRNLSYVKTVVSFSLVNLFAISDIYIDANGAHCDK